MLKSFFAKNEVTGYDQIIFRKSEVRVVIESFSTENKSMGYYRHAVE